MPRSFRKRRRTNAKGEVFYQIFGPNPETGEDEYRETIKGPGAGARANRKVKELTTEAGNLDDFGKMETRKVSDLAEAFVRCKREQYQDNLASGEWHRKGRKCSAGCKYDYERFLVRFIAGQKFGEIILIALTFERLEAEIRKAEREFGAASGLKFGTQVKAMLRWGAKFGWKVRPLLLSILSDVYLPPRATRKHYPSLEAAKKVMAVVMGVRGHQESRRHYLYNRALHLILVGNGAREAELGHVYWKDVDLDLGTIEVTGQFSRRDRHLKGTTKTEAGLGRTLWICWQAVEVLRFMKEHHRGGNDDLVFDAMGKGKSIVPAIYAGYLKATQRRAGLTAEEMRGFGSHGLRHNVASAYRKLGVDTIDIKLALGHSLKGISHDSFASKKQVRADVTDGYIRALPALRMDTPSMTPRDATQYLIDVLMPEHIAPLDEQMLLTRDTPEGKAANAAYGREWRARMRQTEEGRRHLQKRNRKHGLRRRTGDAGEKNRAYQREWARKHRAAKRADNTRTNQD
jgi:integrase